MGLLVSAGDVWAAVLELNAWRRARQDQPLVGYQELCRELAASGPGTFGELDSDGARSVLRRYSDAWFAAAKRRRSGDQRARFPRRRRALMALRWYHGTFRLAGRRLRIPVARGRPEVSMDQQVKYLLQESELPRQWYNVIPDLPAPPPPPLHPGTREPVGPDAASSRHSS